MTDYPHIEAYYGRRRELEEFGGSDSELNIRPAFQNCLDAYCREHRERLVLVPEKRAAGNVVPDGTVRDSLRMARGYWEAKDSRDNLDAEIRRKFDRGYPRDNILFENSRTAVLVQNGERTMKADMSRPGELHRLIRQFLGYEIPNIAEFRKAQDQFNTDLPAVLENLRQSVTEAEEGNESFRERSAEFLALCHRSIGPDVSAADVREMLLQHILTKDIFRQVFYEDQFHRENNVAKQLDTLEGTFFTGNVRREAIDRLRAYYGAIGRAAHEITNYPDKQHFLKAIYEDFYQAYNPAAADRLGVVYTPNEIVDFIIRGVDHLLQKHFGKTLADDNVQIMDPATGTGTFVTNLINHLPIERLKHKYLNEIHANEVAILPYYIANLNIEYTYRERTGRYLEFPNLCFVDTLDNMDWQQRGATGGAVTRQGAFSLGALSEENWIRVQEQNEKPISVIIGNPPYNDSAALWGDGGANRQYVDIDRRIRETYVKEGTAQKTHQYDMYKRFLRWASDRLDDDGVIGFISNRAFLDARQDDGFRKVATEEFTDIYVLDLGSDVRRNPKISGTTHNVFGIQTGVAIGFFVREKAKLGQCGIKYAKREDAELAKDKLNFLSEADLSAVEFSDVIPDRRKDWLNQSDSGFEKLLPLASRETKFAKSAADKRAVFDLFANGVKTNRDDWVYDFDVQNLRAKALHFADTYDAFLNAGDESYRPVIKWSRDLRNEFQRGRRIVYNDAHRLRSLYRPFVIKHHFANSIMNDVLTRNHHEMFGPDLKQPNHAISFSGISSSKPFHVLATDKLIGFDTLEKTQSLPLYRYTPDGERVSNITEWGVRRFNDHYRREWRNAFDELAGPEGITAEDIFAYTYAVLHDPAYRHEYRLDLLREFPRLPFYHDFHIWRDIGKKLLDLHIGFERADPYPLQRVDLEREPGRAMLRADKEKGVIVLDSRTSLSGVPPKAWEYRLGSRSALEWVLDQYRERKPRDPNIAERFNTYRFADHKERVIDLLRRVCTVSVKTVAIVERMAHWDGENLIVPGDRDRREWETMGLSQWFGEPGGPDDDPEYQSWLAALPDIRDSKD